MHEKDVKTVKHSIGTDDIVFYTEIIRLINNYLEVEHEVPARISLQRLMGTTSPAHKHIEDSLQVSSDWELGILNKILLNQSLQKNKSDLSCKDNFLGHNFGIVLRFVEELRIHTLGWINRAKREWKNTLKRYHIHLHLIELYLEENKTMYEKINDLLNTNFALKPSNIIGNACRGNYGILVSHNPTLAEAFEKFGDARLDKQSLIEWKIKFNIPNDLFQVVSGDFVDFDNRLEEHCYRLLHGIETKHKDEFTEVLDGKIGIIYRNRRESAFPEDTFLKLISILLSPQEFSLREAELCFEELFHQTFDFDYQTGLDFLAFSRKISFYFYYLLDSINLNSLTVETLLRFCRRHALSSSTLLNDYAAILLEDGEYGQLCRLIICNTISDFQYTKPFLVYFISEFHNFRKFVPDNFKSDPSIIFLEIMSNAENLSNESLALLLRNDLFDMFADEIVDLFLKSEDLSEPLGFKLADRLFQLEHKTGISRKDKRNSIARKIINQ